MSGPITPLTPAEEAKAKSDTTHEGYIQRVLVAGDIFANVVMDGQEDETISSRVARWDTEDKGVKHEVGHLISEVLADIQKDHGALAEAGDLERAQEVESIEEATGTLPTK
jgi:hypothetical protein